MYCVVVTVTEQKHHGVFFIKQARFVSLRDSGVTDYQDSNQRLHLRNRLKARCPNTVEMHKKAVTLSHRSSPGNWLRQWLGEFLLTTVDQSTHRTLHTVIPHTPSSVHLFVVGEVKKSVFPCRVSDCADATCRTSNWFRLGRGK
jgi:hypothetical protein